MRKSHQSLRPATALLFSAIGLLVLQTSGPLLAESISRSEAQTPGEKRLLEWDLTKSYDVSRSRTPPKGNATSRPFSTQSFLPGSFNTKAFSTASFSSPEFLIPEGKAQTKAFPSKPALQRDNSGFAKPFLPGTAPYTPPKVVPAFPSGAPTSPKAFGEATRPFQGPEAARKEQKYVPGNAPSGGVIEGRRLSVDEVKEILNRSK
jgi:hypothetical protein